MKILSSAPLLVAGSAIAIAAISILINIRVSVPNVLELGVGIATFAGVFGMLVQDTAQDSCA